MRAEVIAIGDELTSGERLDTNSQWLSQRLGELGIVTGYQTTVGDDLEAGTAVFQHAMDRADVVISTGGLGPTADDLTRDCLARAAGVELVQNETVLEHLRRLFAHRQRPMPASNLVQAQFPRGSTVIDNPHGTAPGIDLVFAGPSGRLARVFALPGVPAEMRQMWDQSVGPRVRDMAPGGRYLCHRRLKCFGIGESDLEAMLPDLIRRGREPAVGITVHQATITLRITARGPTAAACQQQIASTETVIRECLGNLVFGTDEDELPTVIIRQLEATGSTLATLEWGTGGLLAEWLHGVPRGSAVVPGNLVVSSPQGLVRLAPECQTGLQSESIHPATSESLVGRMATAIRERLSTDWGVAVGPFPEFGQTQAEQARYFYACAGDSGTVTKSGIFIGHPDILKERAAKQALDLLRLELCRQPKNVSARGKNASGH